MTHEHAVLCIGLDWPLLNARMRALKSAGFPVVLARDEKQARIVAGFFRFHAAVLCHSLREDLQEKLTADMRKVQPHLPILQLQAHDCEPDKLIAAVTAVTGMNVTTLALRPPYLSCWARCTGLEQAITP